MIGQAVRPAPFEQGWKDTIQADAGSVTVIRVRFAPQDGSNYKFDPTSGPGYVWHCHILDHEDNEMMRPLVIVGSYNQTSLLLSVGLIAVVVILVAIASIVFWHFRKRSNGKIS